MSVKAGRIAKYLKTVFLGCHCWLAQQCFYITVRALLDKPAVAPSNLAIVLCAGRRAVEAAMFAPGNT